MVEFSPYKYPLPTHISDGKNNLVAYWMDPERHQEYSGEAFSFPQN